MLYEAATFGPDVRYGRRDAVRQLTPKLIPQAWSLVSRARLLLEPLVVSHETTGVVACRGIGAGCWRFSGAFARRPSSSIVPDRGLQKRRSSAVVFFRAARSITCVVDGKPLPLAQIAIPMLAGGGGQIPSLISGRPSVLLVAFFPRSTCGSHCCLPPWVAHARRRCVPFDVNEGNLATACI